VPFDKQIPQQNEQDTNERNHEPGNLGLPRDCNALKFDAFLDSLVRAVELSLRYLEMLLLRLQCFALVPFNARQQFDYPIVLAHAFPAVLPGNMASLTLAHCLRRAVRI